MAKVAVLASGRGSNLEALLRAQHERRLHPAKITLVVSDNPDARALRVARDAGVEAVHVDPTGSDRGAYDDDVVQLLREHDVDLVVLAGFMRILSPRFIQAFPYRIINIHPSMLPAFTGLLAQRRALEAGVRVAGATTHFVTEDVDAGPIILQSVVPVRQDDTEGALAERILETEHRILPESVRLFAEGRLSVTGRRVEIKGEVDYPPSTTVVPEVSP